jgi:hypothetical protein
MRPTNYVGRAKYFVTSNTINRLVTGTGFSLHHREQPDVSFEPKSGSYQTHFTSQDNRTGLSESNAICSPRLLPDPHFTIY